ncbi:uncharacterized protein A4U43_C03F10360 [Asparagus officinalis]|uniref:Uncharacterized protein n=1 Tax=Asparagus officinalis TaxID=4686 RepID=A0A5P1FD66_ASPOF|nr:uncharacterized protein A4U43_C03F10360 [Asparagus officinalis]
MASRFGGKMAKTNRFPFLGTHRNEKRWYRLSCHARHRKLVTEVYLPHVVDEGKAIKAKGRRKRLYTNNVDSERHARLWSSVVFDHPATFGTLAVDQDKKKEVMDDLAAFKERKEYYGKIGRAWKRGYLLYGPPCDGCCAQRKFRQHLRCARCITRD